MSVVRDEAEARTRATNHLGRNIHEHRGTQPAAITDARKDKETCAFFDRVVGAEKLLQGIALKHGLVFYGSLYTRTRSPALQRGLPIWVSPPLSINATEVGDLMGRVEASLSEWESAIL